MDEVVALFYHRYLVWPPQKARSEVAEWFRVTARRETPGPVYVRSAWLPETGALYIDIGNPTWSVIEVTAAGWREVSSAPVTFRRTSQTGTIRFGNENVDIHDALASLWSVVPVRRADRPLVLALLLIAWMRGVPQPIVLVTSQRDSGKTTTARFLLSLIDPVLHERGGSLPPDEASWKARVNTARVILLDNVGHITPEKSDMLSRIATGGEATNRQLYSDDAAHLTELRIPIWITSIDAGVLRDDFASRVVRIELPLLDESSRLPESELIRRQQQIRPTATRALLDLLVEVLSELPQQSHDGLTHRMGDFELVLRCVDQVLGTKGAQRLRHLGHDLAEDVLMTDLVALAVIDGTLAPPPSDPDLDDWEKPIERPSLIGSWNPTHLLKVLNEYKPDVATPSSSWPKTPGVLSNQLRRIAPALRAAYGIQVETGVREGKDRKRKIVISLCPEDNSGNATP